MSLDIEILKTKQKELNQVVKSVYDIQFTKFNSFATKGHKDHYHFVLHDLIKRAKIEQDNLENIEILEN
ncbi:hypothetical protein LX77_03862 [Gelidibacter algens]|uniref:Uncharacterized protein n=1 Tax=Gelidibacter algens TaxID=49280 RepID=A0A327RK71_9FLAO|nr:hypothetical protein [Gelidibacter algens]RAJ17536.1 hypothetical protein LX77_03862 [Gelidibacter algens]